MNRGRSFRTERRIGVLGLGVFEPDRFSFCEEGATRLDVRFACTGVPRADEFGACRESIGALLAVPVPPVADANCTFGASAKAV